MLQPPSRLCRDDMDTKDQTRSDDRSFEAIDDAFRSGDFAALGRALGGSFRWFDETMPVEFGLGYPLEYAIYWSPVALIVTLIEAGSNPNYLDDAGFPSIIAALSSRRDDRLEIVRALLGQGADPNRRGLNDWTPLHFAVSVGDTAAIELLLSSGADPSLRTRIDDCTTALEDASKRGFRAGATLLQNA